MSLARLALRLAAYEALNPFKTVYTGPWPTIAGSLVYDSRIDPVQEGTDLDAIEGRPLLIIYTEQDSATPYGTAKYPPDEQIVHLVIEAMIAAKAMVEIPGTTAGGEPTYFGAVTAPIADYQHEALLDLLESMVRRVFDLRNRAPSAALLNGLLMEVRHIESVPQRAEDRTTRLAARTITLTCKIKKEVWPAVPVSPVTTGLAVLPEPLQTVANALDSTSTGGTLCAALAAQLQGLVPASVQALGSISIQTPAGDPSTMNDPITSTVTFATS